MRIATLSLALLSALAIPAAAHADTFSYSMTNGTNYSFTLTASPTASDAGVYVDYKVNASNGDAVDVQFYNPAYLAQLIASGYDYAPNLDVAFVDNTTGLQYIADGLQLYSGSESNPTYQAATYTLTTDPDTQNGHSGFRDGAGTLIVDGGGLAPTPEPGSLVLLGTGALGVLGAARRRFHLA